MYNLLLIPSVTFGLFSDQVEVMPWAIFVAFFYIRKFNYRLILVFSWLFLFAVVGYVVTEDTFEVTRSLFAYINCLLAIEIAFSLSTEQLKHAAKSLNTIFLILIFLGLVQYTQILENYDNFFSFFSPRASATLLNEMGRGVTLISSEPARAGVELIFMYLCLKAINQHMFIFKYDIILLLYLGFIVQSAMSFMLYAAYLLFIYRKYIILIIGGFVLVSLFNPFDIRVSGRVFELFTTFKFGSLIDLNTALFEIINTSGHRLVSIYTSYLYSLYYPLGCGVGNWVNCSVDAILMSGIETQSYNYFKLYGGGEAVGIRASGFFANLALDAGIIGIFLVFSYFVSLYKSAGYFPQKKSLAILFIVKMLFIGSVGTTAEAYCVALVFATYSKHMKNYSFHNLAVR